MAKEHWNKGFATEAARAVVRWGFDELDLDKIYAHADAGNQRSWNVMEKLGMHIERNATGADWPGYAGILYYDDPVSSDEAGGRERA